MYKFLTSKKGFTLVELMIVLVLLSLGVFAIGNLFLSAYRSYNKSEERYLKQEAVKTVAETLRKGSVGVSAAQTADVFPDIGVIPKTEVDTSYSYLFAKEHFSCGKCGAEIDDGATACSVTGCKGAKALDGYYISVLDKGMPYNSARRLSNVPIYMEIEVDTEEEEVVQSNGSTVTKIVYYDGVCVTLAALEDDYDYASGVDPISDDIYYSLDVQYHFPNMAIDSGSMINHIAEDTPTETQDYDNGGSVEAAINGKVLRVYCDSIVGGDATESAIGVPSMCFIATASYGEDSGEVGMLCDFRDKCLLTNPLGEAFVKTYYKLSPPIADFIRESEFLKGAVRTALKPLIVVAEYSLNEDIRPIGIASLAVFMLSGMGATVVLMRVDKRKKRSVSDK